MMRYVDPEFQQRLDQYNDGAGASYIVVVLWDEKADRWRTWIVPTADSYAPGARNSVTAQMMRPLPDGSGRQGVPLNLWYGENGCYLPLDERYFEALRWADSFQDKEHFEKTIEEPEFRLEMAKNKSLRDKAYGARSYWWNMDKLTINPNVKASGDWRHRIR